MPEFSEECGASLRSNASSDPDETAELRLQLGAWYQQAQQFDEAAFIIAFPRPSQVLLANEVSPLSALNLVMKNLFTRAV